MLKLARRFPYAVELVLFLVGSAMIFSSLWAIASALGGFLAKFKVAIALALTLAAFLTLSGASWAQGSADPQGDLIAMQAAVIQQQAAVIDQLRAEVASLKQQLGLTSGPRPVITATTLGACGQASAAYSPQASAGSGGWYFGKRLGRLRGSSGGCQ